MTEKRKKNLGILKYPAMTGTLLALMALAGLMASRDGRGCLWRRNRGG